MLKDSPETALHGVDPDCSTAHWACSVVPTKTPALHGTGQAKLAVVPTGATKSVTIGRTYQQEPLACQRGASKRREIETEVPQPASREVQP